MTCDLININEHPPSLISSQKAISEGRIHKLHYLTDKSHFEKKRRIKYHNINYIYVDKLNNHSLYLKLHYALSEEYRPN